MAAPCPLYMTQLRGGVFANSYLQFMKGEAHYGNAIGCNGVAV